MLSNAAYMFCRLGLSLQALCKASILRRFFWAADMFERFAAAAWASSDMFSRTLPQFDFLVGASFCNVASSAVEGLKRFFIASTGYLQGVTPHKTKA